MESKLTLKLDTRAIKRAKKYVRARHAKSLSKLVENYFYSLTKHEVREENNPPPIVSSLAGVAKKVKTADIKREYTDYLIQKYR